MNLLELTGSILIGVYALLFFGRTFLLSLQGVRVLQLDAKTKKKKTVLEWFLGIFMISWIAALLFRMIFAANKNPLPLNMNALSIMDIIGVCMAALSVIILLTSFISFGKSWRIGIDVNKPGELVTSGIYSISRNPVFLAFDLLIPGSALIFPSYEVIILAIINVILTHFQILGEEKFLFGQYGERYKLYFRNVRRYLGKKS